MPKNSCICVDLRAAAQKVTQLYDEALATTGVSITQLSHLNLIHTMKGPTLKALAAESQLERSTLGRNIRVMEKQGLVTTKVGADARTRTIHLTEYGRREFRRAVPIWREVQSGLLQRLGQNGRVDLDNMLQLLTQPLELENKEGVV